MTEVSPRPWKRSDLKFTHSPMDTTSHHVQRCCIKRKAAREKHRQAGETRINGELRSICSVTAWVLSGLSPSHCTGWTGPLLHCNSSVALHTAAQSPAPKSQWLGLKSCTRSAIVFTAEILLRCSALIQNPQRNEVRPLDTLKKM